MQIGLRIVLALFLIDAGFSKSDGSIPNSACNTMLPGHGFAEQSSASPYAIYTDSYFFIFNLTFKVYIDVEDSDQNPFKGFYCQGRKENAPTNLAGYFFNLRGNETGHNCFSESPVPGAFNTISHNRAWSRNPDTFMTFDWRIANTNTHAIRFRCTFVQSFSVFWVGVESSTITMLESISVDECCDGEEIADGCAPLCRPIQEEPANMTLARTILGKVVEDDELCPFWGGQLALRCTYYSCKTSHTAINYYDDDDDIKSIPRHVTMFPSIGKFQGSETAQDFEDYLLEECCNQESVSSDCMYFCYKETLGTMDYSQNDLNYCLNENLGLASCLIFPDSITQFEEKTNLISTSRSVTSYLVEGPGTVIFNVNVTVGVTGAVQNYALRESVFTALESQLLIPGLAKVFGYIQVRVGVQYYEGSLVVISEGVFRQQSDDSIPTLSEVQTALNARLNEINGEIRNNNQNWSVAAPIQATRKEINGACQTTNCGTQTKCVEVGPEGTVCLCLDSSNNEIDCETDSGSGLSGGAIAGVVIGCLLLVAAIIVVVLFVCRRESWHKDNSNVSKIRMGRHTSTRSEDRYAYPDLPEVQGEPVYMDISNDEPPPPALPPSRIPTLPSHSVAYETPTDGEDLAKTVIGFQENEEGYMESAFAEDCHKSKTDEVKESADYAEPYEAYQANGKDAEMKNIEKNKDSDADQLESPINSGTKQDYETTNEYIALDGYEFGSAAEERSEVERKSNDSKE